MSPPRNAISQNERDDSGWRTRIGGPSATILAAATALALIVRLFNLDGPSLWFDELLEYERATGPWRELLLGRGIDQDPPLFALASRLWLTLTPSHSELWLRMPSALAGSAATWLAGWWAGRRFGAIVGGLSALFVALAPVQVHYARELNQYVWMTLLVMVAIITWERVRDSWAPGDWMLHGAISAVALLTHYGLAFPLIVMGLDLAVGARRRHRKSVAQRAHAQPPELTSPWRPLLVYTLVIGTLVAALLWLGLADRLDTGHVQKRWGGTHLQKELDYILDTGWREVLVFFFLPFSGGWSLPIVRVMSLLSLAGIVDLWRKAPAGRRVFGGVLGGTLVLTYLTSVLGLYPLGFRHGLWNAPLLLVALAGGVAWAGRVVGQTLERWGGQVVKRTVGRGIAVPTKTIVTGTLAAAICAAFIAFSPHEWWANPHMTVPREHGREVARLLISSATTDDAIYVYHAAAPAFRYYGIGPGTAIEGGAQAPIMWGHPFDSRDADEVAREAKRVLAAAQGSASGQVFLYFVHVNAAERAALHVGLEDGPLTPSRGAAERGGNAVMERWVLRR